LLNGFIFVIFCGLGDLIYDAARFLDLLPCHFLLPLPSDEGACQVLPFFSPYFLLCTSNEALFSVGWP